MGGVVDDFGNKPIVNEYAKDAGGTSWLNSKSNQSKVSVGLQMVSGIASQYTSKPKTIDTGNAKTDSIRNAADQADAKGGAMSTITDMGSYAAMGMSIGGPVGAIAGAGVGMIKGVGETIAGNKKAKKLRTMADGLENTQINSDTSELEERIEKSQLASDPEKLQGSLENEFMGTDIYKRYSRRNNGYLK